MATQIVNPTWDGDSNNAFVVHPDLSAGDCHDAATARMGQALAIAKLMQVEAEHRGEEKAPLAWALEAMLLQARAALRASWERHGIESSHV